MKPQIKMGSSITNYHQVKFSPGVMLSPYSTVVGDVFLGAEASVFAGTQIRGDCEPIYVGAKTNIQENACLHVSRGSKLTVGNCATIGHGAILHGCTIDDNVLVGMGAIVMDKAHIERDCLIAAGAIVTQGKHFPAGSLIVGSPARAVRQLTPEEIEFQITQAAPDYWEVGKAMLADGLMAHPSADCTVWPQ